MDNQPDFDPVKIGYDPSGPDAKFICAVIKLKGASPYKLPTINRNRIVTQHHVIEGLDTILEFLDTRFAFNRLLPLDPLPRAITKNLIYNILNGTFTIGESLKDLEILDIARENRK